ESSTPRGNRTPATGVKGPRANRYTMGAGAPGKSSCALPPPGRLASALWKTGGARLAHRVEHRTFNPAGWVRVPGRAYGKSLLSSSLSRLVWECRAKCVPNMSRATSPNYMPGPIWTAGTTGCPGPLTRVDRTVAENRRAAGTERSSRPSRRRWSRRAARPDLAARRADGCFARHAAGGRCRPGVVGWAWRDWV
ncbi:MAG: hypothetical protein QOI71_2816, partial [Gaiellales bacterium]|nr:hypothetical protein [Gaiellales bacterium]